MINLWGTPPPERFPYARFLTRGNWKFRNFLYRYYYYLSERKSELAHKIEMRKWSAERMEE